MKKLIALILAGVMLLSFAACGGSGEADTKEPAAETTAAAAIDVADAADLLNKVWAKYADTEKFFVMGGDMSNPVSDGAGKFDITLTEDLDNTLGLPQANAAQIDDAASLAHAMNANNFTAAAYHLTAGTDASAFAAAIDSHLATRQWICGFPETLLILGVGDYVVTAFGTADNINVFKTKLSEEFASAQIFVEKPIA